MDALTELAPILGVQAAGDSLAGARAAVLACLHPERFPDQAPAAIHATLRDEGPYLCSVRTMYRVLEKQGASRPRRDQLVHPPYQKPERLASAPNPLWSWDITKRLSPAKWTCSLSTLTAAGACAPRWGSTNRLCPAQTPSRGVP
jgi:hypothetical protein